MNEQSSAAVAAKGSEAANVGLFHPLMTGALAAIVGFAGAFPIVLNGLAGVGASPDEAASGLLTLCIATGILGAILSWRTRQPILIAWSTPGAAILITAGVPAGGYSAAVGAFIAAGLLIVVSGLWRPFGRLVSSIPMSIASAMLAGVLAGICYAPVKAVETQPWLALPIVVIWGIGMRFFRLWAVPAAVVVTALIVAVATKLPPDALAHVAPTVVFVMPSFSLPTMVGIALPLFIVTMASQNVPGLTVMRVNGYQPDVPPIFVSTGLASMLIPLLGGHTINLAAITAALCAQPEAHPNPAKRWIAVVGAGGAYLVLGLMAGLAAAFIAAAPPMLIQAVAGLALLGSMAGALAGALVKEEERLPAAVTFVTTASGFTAFGIGSAFWGLVAGGLLLALFRMK